MQVSSLPRHERERFASRRSLHTAKPRSGATRSRAGALALAHGLMAGDAAKGVGSSRASLYRWAKRLEPKSRRPHRAPSEDLDASADAAPAGPFRGTLLLKQSCSAGGRRIMPSSEQCRPTLSAQRQELGSQISGARARGVRNERAERDPQRAKAPL